MNQAPQAPETTFATLREWYLGEVWGEAAFLALAGEARDDASAEKWRGLARLELATRELIGASIRALGGTPPPIEPQPDLTERRVRELAGKPWRELMQWLERMAAEALDVMTRESAALPAQLAPTVTWVLDHERALLEFAHHELAGDGARSLDRARAMLATASGTT
jgi:hypothetical protein